MTAHDFNYISIIEFERGLKWKDIIGVWIMN